ncbi:MAG TPA: VOC family protein [Acidimicrobiales bacterium]
MAISPYLTFGTTCREAFTRYQKVFGGDLEILEMSDVPCDPTSTPEQMKLVAHASLTWGDNLLMGSDDPTGRFEKSQGTYVCYSAPNVEEAERVWAELSEGGEVEMPLGEAFFSPRFGTCVDRFGTPWMVVVDTGDTA